MMSARSIICGGAAAVVLSVVGIFLLIVRSFLLANRNENAGIGAVGGAGVELALLVFLGGVAALVIGFIKWLVDKRRMR
jgi:hypothetical protein